MQNKEIAQAFKLLSALMDIQGENAFKSRSYANAAFQLARVKEPLAGMDAAALRGLPGVGEAIADKIRQLANSGSIDLLDRLLAKTPAGLLELVSIRGIGPKKVGALYRELGIESPGELLYACSENRLLGLKGFGAKTQDSFKKALEFYMENRDSFLYADLEHASVEFEKWVQKKLPSAQVSLTGALRRKCELLEKIEILVDADQTEVKKLWDGKVLLPESIKDFLIKGRSIKGTPIWMHCSSKADFALKLIETTGSEAHLIKLGKVKTAPDEAAIYKQAGKPYVVPEMREGTDEFEAGGLAQLLDDKHIKGILHAHSTYSDGINSLREMAAACKDLGYGYLGISDHSKSAVYAGGLSETDILRQHKEIDLLNLELAPFRILKGIESDILQDGSLDYDEQVLGSFDFIIASIHGQLQMDKKKATQRIVKAIQNPYTRILGHPTGRLLLSRPGYELDWEEVMAACRQHSVCIELNANPRRLDVDWRLIPMAVKHGVMIAVNPDAHSLEGLGHVHYGVLAARKAGLLQAQTLNCLAGKDLMKFFDRK